MEGIPTVTVEQLALPLPEGLTVLDVREPVEWQHGHIEGSRHVPMHEIPDRLRELPTDGNLLVVCKVGARSAHVVQFLHQQGIEAINLDGGLVQWHHAGRPLVSDLGEPTVF